MELKRDIYADLLEWKRKNSGHVLELRGARQVGKTFILDKFARENYRQYLYINMVQTSGKEFLECLDQALKWEPGMPRKEKPLHEAFSLFRPDFCDEMGTIVVIDEIQESGKVYSLIRQFAREFICHFVVTGSYLGRVTSKEYFQPMGDLDILTLYTLSFEEFLDAIGKRELYQNIDLYGTGRHEQYEELKDCYDKYCKIGGYPAVVKRYLETKNTDECMAEINHVIRIFIEESQNYFENILEMNLFEQLLPAIASSMVKENKGSKDLVNELSSILFREESNRISKKMVNQAIAWLYRSHIINYCGRAEDCNPVNVVMNCRFYFMDLGVCRCFMNIAGVDEATMNGIINENFVYIDLVKRIERYQIAGTAPMFGTYKDGELDFVVNSRKNFTTYGVEVKAGKAEGKTAKLVLRDKKVEAVYFLKGNTYGGIEGNKLTVPVYLAGRVAYDYKQ